MTASAEPPRWADALLRLMLKPDQRENVSGDVLEEYRNSIRPGRGAWRADAWYIRQAAGRIWRTAWVWGVLLAAAVTGREAFDWWLSPTNDFYARSIVSTAVAVGVFTCAGLATAWRTRSVRGGVLAGVVAGAIAAGSTNLSSLALLAVRHDPHTMAMIRASGGLDEVFLLPWAVIVPGAICASAGALAGKTLAWSLRSRLSE